MTKDKEFLLQLERIANALEDALPLLEKIASPPFVINLPPPAPAAPTPVTVPSPYGGYRCVRCGTWVPAGVNTHACNGGSWPQTGISPNVCRVGSAQSSPSSGAATIVYNGVSCFPIAGTAVGDTAS